MGSCLEGTGFGLPALTPFLPALRIEDKSLP